MICRSWKFVYPTAAGGIDNPMINPFAVGAPKLSGIRCSRVLVCVGEKEITKYRGIQYCESLRESGWEGEVELYEVQGGEHGFHIRNPETEIAKNMALGYFPPVTKCFGFVLQAYGKSNFVLQQQDEHTKKYSFDNYNIPVFTDMGTM
ncbi:hypothetical protein RJ639_018739 [Escallonia herrerae]|uniref:Alpha/beta hydrolase fold-3 domain-containing protein n=1 Tax=Escallonia herrerae TaxID=1293975 RepID=A0AA89AGN1_9ASTE|nr:hypothetical protein RJ639_018739 [Escallonia herrerae]